MGLYVQSNTEGGYITASNMEIGQVGVVKGNLGRSGLMLGEHVLRVFWGFVCLERPDMTWGCDPNFLVELLPDGAQFTYRDPAITEVQGK